jgi:hypothetical protein
MCKLFALKSEKKKMNLSNACLMGEKNLLSKDIKTHDILILTPIPQHHGTAKQSSNKESK